MPSPMPDYISNSLLAHSLLTFEDRQQCFLYLIVVFYLSHPELKSRTWNRDRRRCAQSFHTSRSFFLFLSVGLKVFAQPLVRCSVLCPGINIATVKGSSHSHPEGDVHPSPFSADQEAPRPAACSGTQDCEFLCAKSSKCMCELFALSKIRCNHNTQAEVW